MASNRPWLLRRCQMVFEPFDMSLFEVERLYEAMCVEAESPNVQSFVSLEDPMCRRCQFGWASEYKHSATPGRALEPLSKELDALPEHGGCPSTWRRAGRRAPELQHFGVTSGIDEWKRCGMASSTPFRVRGPRRIQELARQVHGRGGGLTVKSLGTPWRDATPQPARPTWPSWGSDEQREELAEVTGQRPTSRGAIGGVRERENSGGSVCSLHGLSPSAFRNGVSESPQSS